MTPTHNRVLLTCQGMGRSIPSPEPSASVSQRTVSKFIFCSTLHQRFQSRLQKVLYLQSFYSLCRKMHKEWCQTTQWCNKGTESSFLNSITKIPTAKGTDWHTPLAQESSARTASPHAPLIKSLPLPCLCLIQPQNLGSVICSEFSFQDLPPFEAEFSVTTIPGRRRMCEQVQIYRDRDGVAVMRL